MDTASWLPLPDPPPEPPAALIAGDLTIAIQRGLIRPDEPLPSQSKLMLSYGVSVGTVSSALAKLTAAGLIRTEPGRGTYAVEVRRPRRLHRNPIVDLLDAADLCRWVAGRSHPAPGVDTTVRWDWDPRWDDPHIEDEKKWPPRRIDVAALLALDRHVVRWLAESFLLAARRVVHAGLTAADDTLLAAARSILDHGGRVPDDQPSMAVHGGPVPTAEDVSTRIWPERRMPVDPDGPPF